MNHAIRAITLVFMVTLTCVAQESDEREADAISIGQAFAANWDQLRQYDLLMTLESFEMTPNGETEEQFDTYRLIADHENGRFCFAQSSKRESTLNANSPPVTKRLVRGFVYDQEKKSGWLKDAFDDPYNIKNRTVVETLGRSQFPDVRKVGFLETPMMFNSKRNINESYQVCFSPEKIIREQNRTGATTELVVDVPTGSKGMVIRTTMVMDTQRFLPIKSTDSLVLDDETSRRRREHIKWQMIKGVHVPKSVIGEKLRLYGVPGQYTKGTRVYDATYHWLSVNEPVLAEDIAPQRLLDPQKLIELTSPDLNEEIVSQ